MKRVSYAESSVPIDYCSTYVDSSTWYPSYTIYVGISIPMVAMHWLHPSYDIYVQAMLVPSMWPYVIYHGLSPHPTTLAYWSLIPSSKTYQEHHSPHIFTLTSHQVMTSNVIACRSISSLHPMMAPSSRYPRATSSSSPHHHFKSSSRSPSSFLTKFYLKALKIQASRLAFSLD